MPFESPRLDDRSFDDIVQEAIRRIPLYTPEWTDHNLSDPGITLVELFAWMTDIILYRLNRVPDRHYIKLMELIGMKLREPEAASTRVTFWLSAPQPIDIKIPMGTEVSTTRTENDPAIIFSTNEEFLIRVAEMTQIITSHVSQEEQQRKYDVQNMRRVAAGYEGFMIFQEKPQAGDAIYFGFRTDLSHHILGLELDVDVAGGAGIDPTRPPYVWQALTNTSPMEWTECEVDADGTKGFNVPGVVRLHLPKIADGDINGRRGYWVRCRIKDPDPTIPQYRRSPIVRQAGAASWGCTIPATHATRIRNEVLGRSDGAPGQAFSLQNTPVLKRRSHEYLAVIPSRKPEEVWIEVADFANSKPDDKHYAIDSATGQVRFGPVMPQRDGSMQRFGAIPERRAMIIMREYRHGGGSTGNLQRGALNVLKTSIPYINRVLNRQPATGGLDMENLDTAKMRVPGYLRSLQRAVVADDFEYLTQEAAPGKVSRVFALQPPDSALGEVKVLIIPRVNNPEGRIGFGELQLDTTIRDRVREYLDERRLLTVKLDVTSPAYYYVSVKVRLKTSSHEDADKVKEAVLQRLYSFLNPIVGGSDGNGWPFGRDLTEFDVVASLQSVQGIDFVRSVQLFPVTWKQNRATVGTEPVQKIEVVAHGVIVSYTHEIEIE